MRGVIYKYVSPTNKVYIGQTLNEYARKAMWKNINHPYAGPYINNARAKYGCENFKYKVLAVLESEDEVFLRAYIDELEQYYINLYDSRNPSKGYNITPGGLGHKGNQNALISPQCRAAQIKCATGRKQSKEEIHKRYLNDPRHKRIKCYTIEGQFIKEYFSLKEAASELQIPYQAIQRVLKGTRKKTRNYIFKFSE